jgi:hypothetical protein
MSAREVLAETIRDPLLIEMLLCPLMWYGNPRERDMAVRPVLHHVPQHFSGRLCAALPGRAADPEEPGSPLPVAGRRTALAHRRGADLVEDGRATGVVLDNGQTLAGPPDLSSAGLVETLRMCEDVTRVENEPGGQLSFVEAISCWTSSRGSGHDRTIVFYNDSDRFHWQKPRDGCATVRTGVICSPNNYAYDPSDGESARRHDPDHGAGEFRPLDGAGRGSVPLEKLRWYDRIAASAVRFVPDYRSHVIDTDMFTPSTIRRFTWHDNGAVYGRPRSDWTERRI